MENEIQKPVRVRKYFTFKGRVSFSEFWWFFLAITIVFAICSAIDYFLNMNVFAWLCVIVFLVPYLSYSVRRLHDINKSGWWVLIDTIPVFGFLYLLALFVRVGDDGANRFGPPVDEFEASPSDS